MHVRNTLFILLATVLFFACHKKPINKSQVVASETVKSEPKIDSTIKNAIIDTQVDMAATGAFYKIDSVKIDEDILSVFVNYSGGCKTHSFDLYSNGMYGKSLPPQLLLCLKHNNNGDNCRGLLLQELKFNVSNLKYPGKIINPMNCSAPISDTINNRPNPRTVVLKLADKKVPYLAK